MVSDRGALDDRTAPETRALVEFLVSTTSSDLPDEVVNESRRCLLDFLGVAIGAVDEPAVTIARRLVRTLGGEPQTRSLGTDVRLRVTDAALVNGIAAHALDFDDTHVPTILHPTTPLYAASLGLADWLRRPGRDVLAAHAVGYEVAARASVALYPEHYDAGWHMTGTTGCLASAAAAARLLGLSAAQAVHCLGLAATQASGHREQFGTMTKPFHAGHAAAAGVLAALLARDSFTAAPDPLQGRRGMFSVMSPAATVADLVDGLGKRWEIFNNGVKPYACGVVIHPAIDSVGRLRDEDGLTADDIERIELNVSPLVRELTGKLEPRTGLEGKFSAVFACAIRLIDGAARQSAFTDENVRRPDVRDLMRRIILVPTDAVDHTKAVASAVTRDGRRLERRVDHASGTPENRLPDAELSAKFHDLVDPVLGPRQAAELEALVWSVDELDDLGPLMLAATPQGR
jgi:2-methylcitrate dehydratase PrpD